MRPLGVCTCALLLQVLFDVRPAAPATRNVRSGDSLQAALDAAQPGDVLLLDPGATFKGNFVLPVKSGTAVITIRSGIADAEVPEGTRMTPARAGRLARIVSPNTNAALRTAPGAHHWRIMLLEFPPTHLGYGDIIRIGDGSGAQSSLSQVPYEIELDRLYIHGHPLYGQKRGVALNARAVTIRNCYISDIKAVGIDTQAIGGWNGPGPFLIENNYLEASGENFMLGGADPAIAGLVSADVVFRRNMVSRPLSWRNPIIPAPAGVAARAGTGGSLPAGTYTYRVIARRAVGGGTTGRSDASVAVSATTGPGGRVTITWQPVPHATEYRVYGRTAGGADRYWTVSSPAFTDSGAGGTSGKLPSGGGTTWTIKNLFELKNARRVLVEYNVFENNWADGQPGYAILFTPRNQGGRCPWCVVEDVTFQYNVVRNAGAGINLLGRDYPNQSAVTNNIRIRHNLFYGLTSLLGGNGFFMLIGGAPTQVTVVHNTIDADGGCAVYVYGGSASNPARVYGFTFADNALRHRSYGIMGANHAPGTKTIAAYFPDGVVKGNWFQGGKASSYPAGNYFSGTFEAAFANVARGDYRLSPGSVLRARATDGTDIGANVGYVVASVEPLADWRAFASRLPAQPRGLRIVGR